MLETKVLQNMYDYFAKGITKDLKFRKAALKNLYAAIKNHEAEIYAALYSDLSKHQFEAYATEVGIVLHEITLAIKNLRKWSKPKRVGTPLMHAPASSKIYNEPYGIVLIMSPWNYPFQLTLAPLVGAIAAGNCAIVKPSNYSLATSNIINKIIDSIFTPEYVKVLTGGREVNKTLFEQKFDYIFFTGSVSVGRTAMEAAAKYLTPITLELGGKSPCIVDETSKIDLAAKRIIWGKFLNAGQTCVAPDYIYVHQSVKKELIESMKKYITQLFGKEPHNNPDFPKIINEKHFERLLGLMQSGNLVFGGSYSRENNKIAPTLQDNVTWDDNIMKEEIFGPLLPILTYKDLNQVIRKINSEPKPLALYLFSTDKVIQNNILKQVSFGGGCINDTVIHVASSLPFGGVGNSGMGSYHGKASFDTFSHKKSILKKSNLIDIPLRYPPYKRDIKVVKPFLK